MTDLIVLLRLGTTGLEVAIIGLFLFMAFHVLRLNRDFVRARLSLNADRVLQAILALLAGFVTVALVSLSFVVGLPLTGVPELLVLYVWLLFSLLGTVQLFRAIVLPLGPALGRSP